MKLAVDPISGRVGVQLNPNKIPDSVYNDITSRYPDHIFCAGFFFFPNEAERLKFVLKYQHLDPS